MDLRQSMIYSAGILVLPSDWSIMGRRPMEGRNGEIWRLYCRGRSQQALSEQFEISQQRVSQIVNAVRDSIEPEEKENILKREVDFLSQARDEVMELWDKGPNKAYSASGRELEGVEDHSGRLAALARAESITARMHRILGVDAPQKLDLNLQGEEEAVRKAAADALVDLHGGTDEA